MQAGNKSTFAGLISLKGDVKEKRNVKYLVKRKLISRLQIAAILYLVNMSGGNLRLKIITLCTLRA